MTNLDGRYVKKKLSDLDPAEYNPRGIDRHEMDGLQVSIDRFGLVQPIVWNKRSVEKGWPAGSRGAIVGGHQRLKVLHARGATETTVVAVDLNAADEKSLNITLNNPHVEGSFTGDLQDVLRDIRDFDPSSFFDLNLADLFEEPVETVEGDDAEFALPTEPVTQPGDIWILGSHRIICGDATDSACVAALLGNDKPSLLVTDPPYGVNYDPDWRIRAACTGNIAGGATRTGRVANDDRSDWTEAYKLFPGNVAYVWHSALLASDVARHLEAVNFFIRAQIIWKKQHIQISRGHYHWKHEACWYAVRKGKSASWIGDRKQNTIWEIPFVAGNQADATGHGTQKPVECMMRPMLNHGPRGGFVYDPFLGSGTSVIAAERASKTLLGLDIDPAYVDVAVERWQTVTGGKAKRVAAGSAPSAEKPKRSRGGSSAKSRASSSSEPAKKRKAPKKHWKRR